MTSLLDRPITAASDDGAVCRWHAAKLWQTHAVKYEIIEVKSDLRTLRCVRFPLNPLMRTSEN